MGTTGTIGTATFNNQKIIDYAFRACRLAPQQISGEYIQVALDQMQLMLYDWPNDAVPLWCKTKYILPMLQGVPAPIMPTTGIVDILEANLRQCTRFTGSYTSSEGNAALAFDSNPQTACTQATAGGNITLQLTTATAVENVGIMPAVAGTWDVALQYSGDGATWITFYQDAAFSAVAGQFAWLDFDGLPVAKYWRLQATAPTVLNVAELFFGNNPMEIPVARINVDDYWNLPNKKFQGRPVQYWCDRQASGPVMRMWPVPALAYVFQQITILAHRFVMDVGDMRDTIEAPLFAFNALFLSLAEKLRLVIPEVDKQATAEVPQMAMDARKRLWGQDVDDSPINLQLDISPYTS